MTYLATDFRHDTGRKGKIHKLYIIKVKIFVLQRTLLRKRKDPYWEKNSQIIYLIKKFYLEYIKYSYNLTTKR